MRAARASKAGAFDMLWVPHSAISAIRSGRASSGMAASAPNSGILCAGPRGSRCRIAEEGPARQQLSPKRITAGIVRSMIATSMRSDQRRT